MKKLDYKIINGNDNVRRQNWRDFVENIQGNKQNKIAILSIHFNNTENTKKLLQYLEQEKNKNFDIIIIENSTKKEEIETLKLYCTGNPHITIITPLHNIGSAGGYAIGMEYIISQKYEYFFIVEDDVIFLDENIFSNMTQDSNQNTLTFINNCKNTRASLDSIDKGKSRWVQIAGYPVNFIEKIGIIDPRYFFRGEDLERGTRIEQGIKKYGYDVHITNKNYLHPYLKSVNNNYARFYFSIRNQLLSLEKHFIKNIKFFLTLFFYLRTAFTKTIIQGEKTILKSYYNAIIDFFKHKYSFNNNIYNIQLFLKNTSKEEIKWTTSEQLATETKQLYSNPLLLFISGIDRENIKFSKNIINLFTQGILISSSSTIFTTLYILAPKIIHINEFDLENNQISISIQHNKYIIKNIIFIVISFIASLGVIIILFPIIILYIGYNKVCTEKK